MNLFQLYLLSVVIAFLPPLYKQRGNFRPDPATGKVEFGLAVWTFVFALVVFGFLWPVYWGIVGMIFLSDKIMDLVWNS